MSTRDKRKCFTFMWSVENINYYWKKEFIRSPTFVINALQESNYFLNLYLDGLGNDNCIHFFLNNLIDSSSNKIDCELAYLSNDGAVLKSVERLNVKSTGLFIEKKEVFVNNRSSYRPKDKLILRCKIWKRDGEMTEDVQCFARTRICIKREAFLWNIQNFSSLHSEEKCTYQIKSMPSNEVLMSFDLLIKNPYTDEDSINIQPVSENGKIKYCVFYIMPLNGPGSADQSIKKEILFSDNKKPKLFTLPFSKNDLIARKDLCLPNDVLSLRCECTYTTGDIIEEIESVFYGCDGLSSIEADNKRFDEENTSAVSKRILNDDLKSLFHDDFLSDIKLKTSTKTFSAHKSILSARSPVFKAMFSNNMKEKLTDCVEIKDIDSETVFRMLLYVYTAEIQDLPCENVCELYRAADIYQILALRDECSTYIKSNLSPINACEVLILADMHQDEYLKASVQEFIFNHDVLNSEEWKLLIKNHAKLAADTMYLQIQSSSTAAAGTTFKFNPPTGVDVIMRGGVSRSIGTKIQCITCMKEYENKSFEELRVEDYAAKRKGDRTIGVTRFPTPPAQKTSILGGSPFTFGGNQSADSTGAKKFPDEFGMKSDWTPLAFPQLSSIPKTETAYPGFNSSSIKIPSASNIFNFSTTEKFSFGNSGQKTPIKSSFSFGNISEKGNAKLSFSFDNSDKKEPDKPSFLFGNSTKKEPSKASFSFRNISEKEHPKSPFSFGNICEKEPTKPSFLFDSSDKKEFVTSTFSFGNICEKEPTKPSISFSNCREKEPIKSSFSFDSSDKKEFVAPSLLFGNISEKEPIKSSFLFDSSDKSEPVKPSFTFQNCNEKEPVKPCLTFGSSDEKEPAKQSFTSSDAKEPVQQSFSFGFHPFIAKKEPIKKSLSNSRSDRKEPVKSPFSFADSGEKEPIKPSFSFNSSSEKKQIKSFSFEKSIEKEPVKPPFSFSSSNDKEHVKSSFSVINSNEKERDKQSFLFSSSDEKESVNQSSSMRKSCAVEFSPSSGFNNSTGQEFPRLESISTLTTCTSVSAQMNSAHLVFNNSNAKTSSASLGFKGMKGDSSTETRIVSSIVGASTAPNGINSTIPVKPSKPFFAFDSISVKASPSFSGLNSSNKAIHFYSPASHTSSVETPVSSTEKTREIDGTCAKIPSASTGYGSSFPDTPATAGIGSANAKIPSELDFSSEETPSTSTGCDSSFADKLATSEISSSSVTILSASSELNCSSADSPSASTGCGSSSPDTPVTSGVDSASTKVSFELDCTSVEKPSTYAMTYSASSGFDSTNKSTLPATHAFDSIPAEITVCSGSNMASSETKCPPFVLDCDNRGTFTTSECKPS
ncbi:unnamed protein product [Larinioides sclopetarius]|uniref:Nuclear pore complex protein Nup98-Nup96 n=1 Tax=Larinioides sclopetarius TaxID=280406 RepID=A0AAV2AJC5_9ARAC